MIEILDTNLIWEQTPVEIAAHLPDDPYEVSRQPVFADKAALARALDEVQLIEPVATPESVVNTRQWLADIAINHSDIVVVQVPCNERVGKHTPGEIATHMLARRNVVNESTIGNHTMLVERGLGQNTKPRSMPGGYCGDMVNDPDDLTPDPQRIVAAAAQARDVQHELAASGKRAITAHEALLLPYEQSRIAVDSETGVRYLLSADIPWIGDRTSNPDGAHVEMLHDIQNAIGIKVGDKTTPEHIAAWAAKLNPDQEAGKLIFMIRMSAQNVDAMRAVIRAITETAPRSIILYDMHEVTEDIGGQKIRAVSRIIDHIRLLARVCAESDAVLDGVHLEAETLSDGQMQCVDEPNERPNCDWTVDPQLSLEQLRRVLDECEPCFGKQRVAA